MLSFAVLQATYQATHFLWGWTALRAINLVSALAGACFVALAAEFFRGCRHRGLSVAVLVTAGFMALFHGHVETYAQPAAALLLHLLALRRVVQRRWPLWTACFTFSLALAFHLVVLFLLPALLLFIALEARRARSPQGPMLEAAAGLFPGACLLAAVTLFDVGYGATVEENFVFPLPQLVTAPWLLVLQPQLFLKFQFMVWNGGVAAVLAFLVFARTLRQRRHDRFLLLLGAYFVCLLVFFIVWKPDMQERDFDLFSFPWILACVAVALQVVRMPGRALWLGLILGSNLLLWVDRPLQWAQLDRRGTGVVVMDQSLLGLPWGVVLLNDRLPLRAVNDFIAEGAQTITLHPYPQLNPAFPPAPPPVPRVLNMRAGELWRVRPTPGGINLVRVFPPPDAGKHE